MPEPLIVPESLSDFSDAELAALRLQIQEQIVELAELRTDEAATEMERLHAEYKRVDDLMSALATRDARAAAIVAEVTAAAEVTEDAEPEAAPVEAAVETPAAEPEAAPVEASEPAVELALEVEAAQAPEVVLETETVIVQASQSDTPVVTPSDVTKALTERRPAAAAPVAPVAAGLEVEIQAQAGAPGLAAGQAMSGLGEVAEAIVARWNSFGKAIPHGVFETISVATAVMEFPEELSLGGDAQINFAKLGAAKTTQVQERSALVASGGICAPFSPSYDIFRKAVPMSPIEECLPTIQAPRGGIRFIVPPDFRDAFNAIGTTTCAEDKDGYVSGNPAGPTPDKPCAVVECPPIQECCVTAVSTCVRFGNLNYRTFPEQVEAFMQDVAVAFAAAKEQLYLDQIAANSTQVVGCKTGYGAARDILFNLSLAAAAYRDRHHIARGTTLTLLLPHWVRDLVRSDMINDASMGLSFIGITDQQIDQALRSAGFDICWYVDYTSDVDTTDPTVALSAPQVDGDLNKYPLTFKAYMFCPGTFVRLDAGTLDLGLVRDSTLNKTNDLELFAEQWVEVCMVGIESVCIELCACPNGAAPAPVDAFACA